jgi:hypothetical protein
MSWNMPIDAFTGDEPLGREEKIELVGTHLRVKGLMYLGRFGRLTDLINAQSGYIRVHDTRLLRRNGDPTTLVLPELMIDKDEISFIAQEDPEAPAEASGLAGAGGMGDFGGETLTRRPRQFVMFTPGHTVTGSAHVYGETDLAGFVDTSDPRFIALTEVTTRSLADRRIISHYKFVLINRTQMIAASETGRQGDIAPEDVPDL